MARRYQWFTRRRDGVVTVRLRPDEAALLVQVVNELRTLLDSGDGAVVERLFPKAYLATARAIPAPYRHMPLWVQFVDRHGEIRPRMVTELRARLAEAIARVHAAIGPEQRTRLAALVREGPHRHRGHSRHAHA